MWMVPFWVLFPFSLLRHGAIGDINVDEILNPTQRCVASDTQTSTCHACVCTDDGIYHCRDLGCDKNKIETTDPIEQECEPLHTYRQDTVFCSCDNTGHWRSSTCRARFHQLQSKIKRNTFKIRTNIECIPDHFYVIDCNICKCHHTGFIRLELCTHRKCHNRDKVDSCSPGDIVRTSTELCSCSDVHYYIDRLCLEIKNETFQEINPEHLNSIIGDKAWDDLKKHCNPQKSYDIDCRKCVCDTNGKITCKNDEINERNCKIPAYKIKETRLRTPNKSEPNQNKYSWPVLKKLGAKCKPGVKYRYKCNTCICNNRMEPVCTSMICLDDMKLTLRDLKAITSQYQTD